MSESNFDGLGDCALNRRRLLTLLPTSVAASALPINTALAASMPVSVSEVQASLLALWDGRQRRSSAYIRRSSIENVNRMIDGCYAAFVRPPADSDLHRFLDCSSRFGQIRVEVTFRKKDGLFQSMRSVERCYLLRGNSSFDSGNMIGFLRQTCPRFGQRFAIYKPYNHWAAQLIGTTDGIVPKKLQTLCIGEFKAERFPAFFELLRGGASQIEVEKIRFPYRRCYIREELEY